MINFKYILLIVFLFVVSILQATTYYVDATNGNDGNDGITQATAWQSIDKVVAMSSGFLPGDYILFKRGEIWNGERLNNSNHASGTFENPITYGSYGSGARPIINIHTVQNPDWTNESINIWTTLISAGSRFFKNSEEMLRAEEVSMLGSYGTEYHVGFINGGADYQLTIYSTTDPATDVFEWSPSSCVVSFYDADYIHFTDIDFQGGASSSIRIYDNIGWKVTNCTIGKNAGGGIKIRDSSEILIDNCILDSNFLVDMSELPAGTSDYSGCSDGIFVSEGSANITVSNSFFKNWGHASFSSNTPDPTKVITNISFHHNELTTPDIIHGGRIGYSGYCEDGEYYSNYIHNIRAQNQLGGSNNHFHHNVIDSVLHSTLEYYVYAKGVSISNYNVQVKDNIIENNTIANTDGRGIEIYSINFDQPGEVSGNIIRNNLLYNCGTLVDDVEVQFHKDQAGQLIYNNIMENNLIYNSNTTQTCMYQYNGVLSDVATFNTQDADIQDNIAGDPLFVDAENANYHLTALSPAIDSGTTSLATQDYDGNTIPNGSETDIGAFEYYDTSGINDTSMSNLVIYPNPVTDKLFFSFGLTENNYQITSLTGVIIKKGKIINNNIDLKDLPLGVYFIKIENKGTKDKILKLIKE